MADQQTQKAATVNTSSRQGTASPTAAVNAASHAAQNLAPLPEEGDQLDAEYDERYSTLVSDGYSDTTSLRSSIIEGVMEHGRRYQAVRDNPLNFASDDKQFDSMEAGHMAYTIIESQQENPYFRSPISKNAQHILDLGTGRGDWAIGVADRFPNLTVHGVDLYPPPASWVPPNCILEVDDFTKPWTWNHKFDFIHLRMLVGALPAEEFLKLYKRAYHNLAPGGWIEHIDIEMGIRCDDGTLPPDSLLSKWRSEIGAIAEKTGNTIVPTDVMRKGIEDAGFTNVHERYFKFPLGNWPKHPVYKEAGECNRMMFKEGLEGWVIFVLTQNGWSKEEVSVYVAKMRQELDANYHIYQYNRRVWAQKPFDA